MKGDFGLFYSHMGLSADAPLSKMLSKGLLSFVKVFDYLNEVYYITSSKKVKISMKKGKNRQICLHFM